MNRARTALYHLYDIEGTLLYVGVTGCLMERLDGHHHQTKWFDQVVRCEVTHYPTRAEARIAEAVAIRDLAPLYNVQGQRPDGRRKAKDVQGWNGNVRGAS